MVHGVRFRQVPISREAAAILVALVATCSGACASHSNQSTGGSKPDDSARQQGPSTVRSPLPSRTNRYREVAAGRAHTCGLRRDGSVICWGLGASDDGRSDGRMSAYQGPAPEGSFETIAAGAYHTCALDASGRAECWGDDSRGQSSPPDGSFAAIYAGAFHTCALDEAGEVTCWGLGSNPDRTETGKGSGDGNPTRIPRPSIATVDVDQARPPEGKFRELALGAYHGCGILRESRNLECWGADGSTDRPDIWQEQTRMPDGDYVDVAAGPVSTCAVERSGTVVCRGPKQTVERVQALASGRHVVQVALGAGHACLRTEAGRVRCASKGDDSRACVPDAAYRTVTAGRRHTCGLRSDGTVDCWGFGEADRPRSSWRGSPSKRYLRRSCSGWTRSGDEGESPGSTYGGGFGHWRQALPPSAPVDAATGAAGTCLLRANGEVDCLRRDDPFEDLDPTGTPIALEAGGRQLCLQTADGALHCRGETPGPERGLDALKETDAWQSLKLRRVVLGGDWGCGLGRKSGGDARTLCWGLGSQPGVDGGPTDFSQAFLPREEGLRALAAGPFHSCSLESRGTGWRAGTRVDCRGYDGFGAAPSDWEFADVAAGRYHTCAVDEEMDLRCWGAGAKRYVDEGVADWNQASPPVGPEVFSVTTSRHANCAVRAGTRGLVCWGRNESGQSNPPDGPFRSVSGASLPANSRGDGWFCGLTRGRRLRCWGGTPAALEREGEQALHRRRPLPPWPKAPYADLSAGRYATCVTGAEGRVACAGSRRGAPTFRPRGRYLQYVVRGRRPVGLRRDGTLAWRGSGHFMAGRRFRAIRGGPYQTVVGTGTRYGDPDPKSAIDRVAVTAATVCRPGRTEGTVECDRGDNSVPRWAPSSMTPDVPGEDWTLRGVAQVVGGYLHVCALGTDGAVECRGRGTDLCSEAPLAYGQGHPPPGRFERLAAGFAHTCGLRRDGSVECWGLGSDPSADEWRGDRLGHPSGSAPMFRRADYDQAVAPSGTFRSIAAGWFHSCATRKDGGVTCWGLGTHPEASEGPDDRNQSAGLEGRIRPYRPDGSGAEPNLDDFPRPEIRLESVLSGRWHLDGAFVSSGDTIAREIPPGRHVVTLRAADRGLVARRRFCIASDIERTVTLGADTLRATPPLRRGLSPSMRRTLEETGFGALFDEVVLNNAKPRDRAELQIRSAGDAKSTVPEGTPKRGLELTETKPTSLLHAIGLREGDVIWYVNGRDAGGYYPGEKLSIGRKDPLTLTFRRRNQLVRLLLVPFGTSGDAFPGTAENHVRVHLFSLEAGATVCIDGTCTGLETQTALPLAPGSREIAVRYPDGRSETETVELEAPGVRRLLFRGR